MNHPSTDIGNHIGALEWGGHMAGHTDDILEKAANGLYPQSHNPNCPPQPTQACTIRGLNCVSDDALEAAGAELALSPTSVQFGCQTRLCAGDDALEAAGAYLNPPPMPTQVRTGCGGLPTLGCRIDDGALEAASGVAVLSPTSAIAGCALSAMCRIGDDALESFGASMAPQVTQNIVCLPRFIDDGALEAAAEMHPGPSIGCGGTMPPVCRFVDDDALEAIGASMGPSPTTPPTCLGVPTLGCRIDDDALEAAGASMGPSPTTPPTCLGLPTLVHC